ncbi:hypothetical protein NRS6131_16970 [Bacillus subtilis]|uniref:hypothetical protein n=1 Tax=Bacillus subtilis TaxID=1423 RepID=UPI001B9F8A4C|nr:hypothetical protein [Bacillus subtilis]CAF1806386.1 hypothetical protein NRS6131_01371 [Bacillus subtilis]CAI6313428.1 hypothetical protein NRS6131_16970 [Bacillus subtilis]
MDSKGFKLTVTVDAKAVSDELDKVTSGLQKEFNELREEYASLKAEYEKVKAELSEVNGSFFEVDGKYRGKSDALLQIKRHVEALANYYNFKEMPNGGGLHYCHDFREIADTVGAKIPNAPFVTARIKAPNVLGDLNNAKIKDIDADKITADAYKELAGEQEVKEYDVKIITDADTITSGTIKAQEIGKKMSEGFEKGVKEAEPFPVMSDKELFGDKLASADLGEAEIINPQTVYFKKAVEQSLKDLDKRIVDALKQALDIKTSEDFRKATQEAVNEGFDRGFGIAKSAEKPESN